MKEKVNVTGVPETMVQRGSAGDYEDKAAVSSRNRSDISDCKVCNG